MAYMVYPLVNCYIAMEIHHRLWVNQLFRRGHFPVRKLLVYQRLDIIPIMGACYHVAYIPWDQHTEQNVENPRETQHGSDPHWWRSLRINRFLHRSWKHHISHMLHVWNIYLHLAQK